MQIKQTILIYIKYYLCCKKLYSKNKTKYQSILNNLKHFFGFLVSSKNQVCNYMVNGSSYFVLAYSILLIQEYILKLKLTQFWYLRDQSSNPPFWSQKPHLSCYWYQSQKHFLVLARLISETHFYYCWKD